MEIVIDTNVACVADGLADHANQACVDACQKLLSDVFQRGGLVLDDGDAIIAEYAKRLGRAGNSGIGSAFVKWASDHRFVASCCRLVRITPLPDGGRRQFEEFPDHEALRDFDVDDHKFVAVALVANAPVANAVDSDWWRHRIVLTEAGVTVEFLCPQHAPTGRRRPSTKVEALPRRKPPRRRHG